MAMSAPAPVAETFPPARLSYATYDEPRYSRLLVVVSGKPHITPFLRYFSCFGEVEEVWGARSNLRTRLQGPVFVKFARSSQALRALEAFRATGSLAWPRFTHMTVAQSRVPGTSQELELDLQKLTVIRVTIPWFFTEGKLVDKFKVYGVIVSCYILRIELREMKGAAFIGFSTPSEAALAIEECDERFRAGWAEAKAELPKHPVLRFGVCGAQPGPTRHAVQGATLNTMCQSNGPAKSLTEPSKVSESNSPVNNPNQETTCKEVQESSLNALGQTTSLAKVVLEPSESPETKSDGNHSKPRTSNEVRKSCVNTLGKDVPAMKPVAPSESNSPMANPKHKTTSNEAEVSSSNTLGKHTKCDQKHMSPTVICTEKKTGSEMQRSNLIPVVTRATLNVPVTRTESERGSTGQNTISHRMSGSNLIILASKPGSSADSSSRNNTEQKGSRTCRSNLITLASVDNTTSSEPSARTLESSVNYWVNHIREEVNRTRAEKSNMIALDYHTSEVQQVSTPPEHSGYEYYVGGTDYSASLSKASVQPPGSSSDYYYCTNSVEQQTDDHSVNENNVMTKPLEPNVCPIYESTAEPEAKCAEVQQDTVLTTVKSLKSSEWKFYMGGAPRRKRSQGNSLLTSVDPPDLASVERSNTSKQSISRHLLMVSKFPLTQEQIFGLFDVIPGLESCETRPGLHRKHVYAMIQYRNVASAVYAKQRLHGLDYPLGNQLHVSFMEDKIDGTELLQEMATQLVTSHLASVIWDNNWAPHLLRPTKSWIPPPRLQTDAVLPSYKRKAPSRFSKQERLLIIFDPCPLPQNVLDNVLSQFGNFVASHFIPGKNGAYAMFAERASASDAIAMLHGKTVNDVKLKVTMSDQPTEDLRKRKRLV